MVKTHTKLTAYRKKNGRGRDHEICGILGSGNYNEDTADFNLILFVNPNEVLQNDGFRIFSTF